MPMWFKFEEKRDKILPGFKPTMRDHGTGVGWTCIRDGWIGYGETAEAAWYDLWSTFFSAKPV